MILSHPRTLVVIILAIRILKVIHRYVLLFSPFLQLSTEKTTQAQGWTLSISSVSQHVVDSAKDNSLWSPIIGLISSTSPSSFTHPLLHILEARSSPPLVHSSQ